MDDSNIHSAMSYHLVLLAVAEDIDLKDSEFSPAFVLMQYFGYLRRNPNDAPDEKVSTPSELYSEVFSGLV